VCNSAHSVTGIFVAAGSAQRMNGVDKVWAELDGEPVIAHSLRTLARYLDSVVLVVRPGDEVRGRTSVGPLLPENVRLEVVAGGAVRQASVRNGLASAGNPELVAVHDAARPFVDARTFELLLATAQKTGAAIPAARVADTIKRVVDGVVAHTVPRDDLWQAQTPQVFKTDLLRQAIESVDDASATDEAALIEALGRPVTVVPSSPANFKITTPDDLARARSVVNGQLPLGLRVGFGYDIHRLVAGRHLVLGGVQFDHPTGLDGHSDADVLLHAIMDAALGAAALGDIGVHFPNTDERWRDCPSVSLLELVGAILSSRGLSVVNIDATLIAESPKIGHRALEMREIIARALSISVERVSVKATTAEGTGAEGRLEAISAHAVATVAGI
jgi:2-C-methyl-D-erythritol 4-phosphate cytidylyltransferase/2-C-methyl-D-erythritol 2,4-cyclodiphosphate synthase